MDPKVRLKIEIIGNITAQKLPYLAHYHIGTRRKVYTGHVAQGAGP